MPMNKQLLRLSRISSKKERRILGLMSGTSLDGLDMALCACTAEGIRVLEFKTAAYNPDLQEKLHRIRSKKIVNMEEVCRMHTELAAIHAGMAIRALAGWHTAPEEVDLLASHGQTIYHKPAADFNSTFQIVDGDHLAQKTNIITISDFRQKHTAAGGEGAPLAALMDEKLFRHPSRTRVLLNLGGIANFTFLPPGQSELPVITSDTGPANTLINEAAQKYFRLPFDDGGEIARRGMVHKKLLTALSEHPYFGRPFPKTTGQEEFQLSFAEEMITRHNFGAAPEDLIATLTQLTIDTVAGALNKVTLNGKFELYVSGGGVHNKMITEGLRTGLPQAEILPFEQLGMHPDAKEAVLMAFLADELIQGNSFLINGKRVTPGKISLPG